MPPDIIYRPCKISDALQVLYDHDIHRRFDFEDYRKYPLDVARYWGCFQGDEIIALLAKHEYYHFYVPLKHRDKADQCLKLFEQHHDLYFQADHKFKDAVFFAMKNGYREIDGVFRK